MPLILYKALITGDRDWNEELPIKRYLLRLRKVHGARSLLLIEGGAPGADTIARYCATELSIHAAEIDALWDTRHRSAGGQRNDVMLALEPHEVMGFHKNLTASRGTRNCLRAAYRLGIPANLWDGHRTVSLTPELLGIRG